MQWVRGAARAGLRRGQAERASSRSKGETPPLPGGLRPPWGHTRLGTEGTPGMEENPLGERHPVQAAPAATAKAVVN